MISSVRVCQQKKQLCNKCKMVKCFFQAIKENPQSISYQLHCSKSMHCSNLYIGNHCMTLLKLHMEWMTVMLIHYFHKWAVIDLYIYVCSMSWCCPEPRAGRQARCTLCVAKRAAHSRGGAVPLWTFCLHATMILYQHDLSGVFQKCTRHRV